MVMRSPLLRVESASEIRSISQLNRAGDLCPLGLNVIDGNVPRVKFLNFCLVGQPAVLIDMQINQSAEDFSNHYIENLSDKATVSTFSNFLVAGFFYGGCLSLQFWSKSEVHSNTKQDFEKYACLQIRSERCALGDVF